MQDQPTLEDLRILCAVVDEGSFRGAAKVLGVSQPRVSRAIQRLEARLGRVLVRRNARTTAPTPLALDYVERARPLLEKFARVEVEILATDPAEGRVGISAPPALGRRRIVPVLARFREANPRIRLQLSLDARRVDLIAEPFDVAIRFGPLAPSSRRARCLLHGHYHLYAAPKRRAREDGASISEVLAREPCFVLNATHLRGRLHAVRAGPVTCDPRPRTRSSGRSEGLFMGPALRCRAGKG